MSDRKIILIALGVAFALLLIYAISFIGSPISFQTSDWGAFGSYAAIGVSSLSIALIYVTYREQRQTNEITRVEQHIVTMTNTLAVLSEKFHERSLMISFQSISNFHFMTYQIGNMTRLLGYVRIIIHQLQLTMTIMEILITFFDICNYVLIIYSMRKPYLQKTNISVSQSSDAFSQNP